MNAFSLKDNVVAKVLAALAVLAILLSIAPQVTLAAPTAVSAAPSSLSVTAGEKVNFVVSVVDNDTMRPLALFDNDGSGTFYNGTTAGACNSDTPDNLFSIGGNKGVCYSNPTPGTYTITANVLEVSSTTVLLTTDIVVTVTGDTTPNDTASTTETVATDLENTFLDICHGFGDKVYGQKLNVSISDIITNHLSDNDIIPNFTYVRNDGDIIPEGLFDNGNNIVFFPGTGAFMANGAQQAILINDCFPLEDTGTSTDDGTGTSTDNGTGTSTDNGTGTSTDDGTGTSTDDGTGSSTENGTGSTTDNGTGGGETSVTGCEFEAHKYNQFGTPLTNWAIGLMKIITHNNGVDTYILDEQTTDNNGYVCLTWDGEYRVPFDDATPSYVDGDYDFTYWLYERMQDGWHLNSIEMGDVNDLQEVAGDAIVYGDHLVRVQYGEENGYIYKDAAYHIDFYNATSSDDNATTTEEVSTSTDPVTGGGDGSSRRTSHSSGTRVDTPEGEVLGASDSVTPEPLVLGEQVTAVPTGGANTGAGGSTATNTALAFTLLLVLAGAIVGARRYNG